MTWTACLWPHKKENNPIDENQRQWLQMITAKKGNIVCNICGGITYSYRLHQPSASYNRGQSRAEVCMCSNDCRNYYYHQCSRLFIVCAIGRLSSISRESIAVPNKRQLAACTWHWHPSWARSSRSRRYTSTSGAVGSRKISGCRLRPTNFWL